MNNLRRIGAVTALVATTAVTAATTAPATAADTAPPTASSSSAPGDHEITSLEQAAAAAYTYTYPLVTMEVSRRQATNVPVPIPNTPAAPTNQLAPLNEVPEPGFEGVVRPNVDTLYTSMFYDVSKQPLVISMPNTGGRYHLVQVMDAWSNVEAAPGTRTLGEDVGAYEIALTGPGWEGELPADVIEVPVDTSTGWLLSRIEVDAEDADDVAAVADLQEQITAVPLSRYGTAYRPPINVDLHDDWPGEGVSASDYIDDLSAEAYWELYYEAASHRQVGSEDRAFLAEMRQWGFSPFTPLDLDGLSAADRKVWKQAKPDTIASFAGEFGGDPVEGWRTVREGIGEYGDDYVARAATAYNGFGANLPADAIYSSSHVDDSDQLYDSQQDYVLHLDADEIPDVQGFWSVTVYDDRGFLVENPIDRSAVRGERLATNPDGSIDVYIQNESPGADKESNWLPTPDEGGFNLMLRAYGPGEEILDGTWDMPGVTAVG